MPKTLRDWILVFIFALIILRLIGLMGIRGQMDTLEENHAAQAQTISELWHTVDGVAIITDSLDGRMEELEGKEVLLIVGAGHEVIVYTADGCVLRCYIPNRENEGGGSND